MVFVMYKDRRCRNLRNSVPLGLLFLEVFRHYDLPQPGQEWCFKQRESATSTSFTSYYLEAQRRLMGERTKLFRKMVEVYYVYIFKFGDRGWCLNLKNCLIVINLVLSCSLISYSNYSSDFMHLQGWVTGLSLCRRFLIPPVLSQPTADLLHPGAATKAPATTTSWRLCRDSKVVGKEPRDTVANEHTNGDPIMILSLSKIRGSLLVVMTGAKAGK